MKKQINILHVAKIDNDLCKGTSVIIPEYIINQSKTKNNVGLLNCNNISLDKLSEEKFVFKKDDNKRFRVFNEFKPDIVIFHEVYKPEFIAIYRFCRKNKIPYIIIPHGCLTIKAQNQKRLKKVIGNKLLFNSFLKNAYSIQYLSNNEYYNCKFKYKNYFILGNGINDIPNNNMYLNSKRENKEKLTTKIIYVGRYDYLIKGLDQLLRACFSIKDKMVKNKIFIDLYGIGTASDIEKLKKDILSFGLGEIVKLNGAIYGEEKRRKISESDVFIQVSRTEGQPLGVMEAMALGMPLLISDGTGFKEIVDSINCGIVTKCEYKNIAKAILDIQSKRKMFDIISINSYNYAISNFKWSRIGEMAILEYKKIINKK